MEKFIESDPSQALLLHLRVGASPAHFVLAAVEYRCIVVRFGPISSPECWHC